MSAERRPFSDFRRSGRTRQYGYRRPDGEIVWFHVDQYGNGISTQAAAEKKVWEFQQAYQDRVGVTAKVELVHRDFLTTEWGRWLKPERSGVFIGPPAAVLGEDAGGDGR